MATLSQTPEALKTIRHSPIQLAAGLGSTPITQDKPTLRLNRSLPKPQTEDILTGVVLVAQCLDQSIDSAFLDLTAKLGFVIEHQAGIMYCDIVDEP